MDEKATMIRNEEGVCWLQTRDDYGRLRSSSCGRLDRTAVECWCAERGIEFRQLERHPWRVRQDVAKGT